MGDSFSWFGLGRAVAVPVDGDGNTTQFSFEAIDDADRGLEETDLPVAGFGLFHGDCLADEGAADVDESALPFDLAGGADFADSRLGRIGRFGKPLGHRAGRGRLAPGGRLLTKGSFRPPRVLSRCRGREAGSRGGPAAAGGTTACGGV